MIEREKRWKLNGEFPKDKSKEVKRIQQTYFNFNPDIRVRKITQNNNDTFFHTVKYNLKDGNREELEHRISKERFDKILETTNKKPVTKDRYIIDLENGLKAEIDDFLDNENIIIEVEFPTEELMNNFVKPDWFGEEIKNNKSFSIQMFNRINNISLWN